MANDECHTPDEFFDKLPFNFTLDAAANARNTKCKKWYSKKDDALSKTWKTRGYVWLNPPYSKAAGGTLRWLQKAYAQREMSLGVICLVICDVSTAARKFAWEYASEIVELSPRINFASPGKGKRTGGLQAYQLVLFDVRMSNERVISRWNWKDEDFDNRREFLQCCPLKS